jgi:hypothetical protein
LRDLPGNSPESRRAAAPPVYRDNPADTAGEKLAPGRVLDFLAGGNKINPGSGRCANQHQKGVNPAKMIPGKDITTLAGDIFKALNLNYKKEM